MDNINNLISVIIPTYNRASRITKAMDSAWNQTYRPIELLIIDDGSKDNTKEVVSNWIKKHNESYDFFTKYIYQENSGAPVARNNGVHNSTGSYLQFLDSDDFIHEDKLQEQSCQLNLDESSICLSDYYTIDDKENIISYVSNDYNIQTIIKRFIGVHTSVPLIKKSTYSKLHLEWNTELKKLQDIDYFIKLFMITDKVSYIKKPLFYWVIHDEDRITTANPNYKKNNSQVLKSLFIFCISNFIIIKTKHYKSISILFLMLIWRSTGLKLPKLFKQKKLNRVIQKTK